MKSPVDGILVPTFRVKVKLTNGAAELAIVGYDISPGSGMLLLLTSMNHVWGAESILLYIIVTRSLSVTETRGPGMVWFHPIILPKSQNVW